MSLVNLVSEAVRRGHHGMVTIPSEGDLAGLLKPFSDSFSVAILPSRLWMGRRYSPPVGLVRLFQAIHDVPAYIQLLKKENFDTVVVNSSVTPVPLVAARMLRLPSILMVRESFMTNPMLKSLFPKWMIRHLLSSWATEVICISKYVADQFRVSKVVVYPQVGREFIDFQPEDDTTQKRSKLNAVMFGTISPEKGQFEAIHAIRIARDGGALVSLDIYGHGKAADRATVERGIVDLGLQQSVKLLEPTNRVLDAYQSADFSIVCSKNEAFGKVTAESILAGRPVVAFGLGGTSEILAFGGGLTTEPTPESMGAAILSLTNDVGLMQKLQLDARNSPVRAKLESSAREVLERLERLGRSTSSE